MIKQSKGITLIALVITIIILLILAGISIQALTNTGLFAQASRAKKETQRAQVTEWLNLKLMEEKMYNPTGTAEEIIEATRAASDGNEELVKMGKEVVVDTNTSTIEDGEQVDVYFYVQVDEDVYKVEMAGAQFIGEAGKFPPVITLESITGTTNSITVTVTTKRNKGGTIKFYIKQEGDSDYTSEVTKTETDANCTFTGLEQNKKYNIKIVAIAENEQTAELLVDKTLGSVPDLAIGDITFTYTVDGQEINKETWTNKNVTVTASTTIEGYTLQTKKGDGAWSNETSQTFTENGKIYAALYDGTNYGGSATENVTNIDITKPIVTELTATTNSIAITATDEASGIVGYAVTESNTEPSVLSFTAVESTTNFNTTVTGKAQGTTYYVWVKDVAENISESKSTKTTTQPVTSITISPTSATIKTGEKVNLTATIKPNDAFNKEVIWNSSNKEVATVSNGQVTAVAVGTTTITATAKDGSGKSASCIITVKSRDGYLYDQGDQCTQITGGYNTFCRYSVAGGASRKTW